jgi:hypothetical protein
MASSRLAFETGVFFDSSQNRSAMGLLQISVVLVVLGGGDCRCWECRAASASIRSRGMIVFFVFLWFFVQFGRCNGLCILFMFLYLYILLYDTYLVIQICTLKKSASADDTTRFVPSFVIILGSPKARTTVLVHR